MTHQIIIYALSILLICMCLVCISLSKLLLNVMKDHVRLHELIGRPIQRYIEYRMPPAREFRAEMKVSMQFEHYAKAKPGLIEREIAEHIVNKLPLEDLKTLFHITIISPYDEPERYPEKIMQLRRERMFEYRARVFIPEIYPYHEPQG